MAGNRTLTGLIKFAVDFLRYQDSVRGLSENIAVSVMEFVRESRTSLKASNIVPLMFLIILGWQILSYHDWIKSFKCVQKGLVLSDTKLGME